MGAFTYRRLLAAWALFCLIINRCKTWLGSSKNNISKLGIFKLLGWLATFFYGGIQAQNKIKLLGCLANPILFLFFKQT